MCQIRDLTESTLRTLMEFKASHDIATHLLVLARENWRDFEAQASPIKGCGVFTDEKVLSNWGFRNDTVLRDDCDIGSDEISGELATYPISAVSLVYMFSILEVYGDEVTLIVNPKFVEERKAWHRKVYIPEGGFTDLNIEKVRNGFGEPFKANPEDIESSIAEALANLKNNRNLIVHKNSTDVGFDSALSSIVAIICHINYLVSSDKSAIKVYPWTDHEDVFA